MLNAEFITLLKIQSNVRYKERTTFGENNITSAQ
jgi:hypothetical protein